MGESEEARKKRIREKYSKYDFSLFGGEYPESELASELMKESFKLKETDINGAIVLIEEALDISPGDNDKLISYLHLAGRKAEAYEMLDVKELKYESSYVIGYNMNISDLIKRRMVLLLY